VAYVRSSYESRCQAARAQRDWPTVEVQARAWTRWQADRALPWLLAAEAAEEQQQHAQAAAYLEQLPDGDPKTTAARLKLVDLYFGPLNQPFAGAATCERILQSDPACGEAHRRLTFFYAMTVQRAKMVQQARAAIEHHCDVPETYVYIIGADWLTFSNAYEWNCRWLTRDPNNELFLAARAVHFIGAKALDESADTVEDESGTAKTAKHERIMTEYLERFPRNAELLSYFLKKACAGGKIERVRELLARAPPEAVDDNRFWRFKGWLHAARKESTLAEGAYRRALTLNPYDWHSQHELADLMRRARKYEEVEVLEARSLQGKELRKAILVLPDIQSIPPPLLQRMAAYAEACGDYPVAQRLWIRIEKSLEKNQKLGPPGVSSAD
jgi:tetratricopeptide (TPR) repeat protein